MVPYSIDLIGTGCDWMSYGGDLVGASDVLRQKISAIVHFQGASQILIVTADIFQGTIELTIGITEMLEPAELTWNIGMYIPSADFTWWWDVKATLVSC